MSQTFTDDWYAQSYNAASAFVNSEANDVALKSNFSGASAPSNVVAGMSWYHTSKGLRIRNAANAAWLKTLQGDATSKTWFYRNDVAEGWLIDTSVTDRVLALKGGSLAYNANGGTNAGTWTIAGLTNGTHTHSVSGNSDNASGTGSGPSFGAAGDSGTHYHAMTITSGSATGTVTSDASHRPAAAIGTLQYPDLS